MHTKMSENLLKCQQVLYTAFVSTGIAMTIKKKKKKKGNDSRKS